MLHASKRTRKDTDTIYTVNKEMNDITYKLRREVMGLIYEIKELVPNLPRIDVRICDAREGENALGAARMKSNFIWITEMVIKSPEFNLRRTVYHEVLHAVYGIDHDDSCPLMQTYHKADMTKAEIQKHFMKWVKKASKKKV